MISVQSELNSNERIALTDLVQRATSRQRSSRDILVYACPAGGCSGVVGIGTCLIFAFVLGVYLQEVSGYPNAILWCEFTTGFVCALINTGLTWHERSLIQKAEEDFVNEISQSLEDRICEETVFTFSRVYSWEQGGGAHQLRRCHRVGRGVPILRYDCLCRTSAGQSYRDFVGICFSSESTAIATFVVWKAVDARDRGGPDS